jgi:ABC-type transporter Mla subunit MlaD
MTSLMTTLPELEALLPRVREHMAVVRERRERVLEVARGAADTFARRAAGARELLEQVAGAAGQLEAQGRAEDDALRAALETLAGDLRAQLEAIAAAREDVHDTLDALEAGGDALRDELALLAPAAAAAWRPVERGAESFRADLQALTGDLPTLTEEAVVDAEEVAAVAGQKQQKLAEAWDEAGEAMDAAFETRAADLQECAERLGEAVELHDVELETAAVAQLDGPGTALVEQVAGRLASDVEQPLRAAVEALALVVGQAGQDEAQTASALSTSRAELAEAAGAVRELLPATVAQIAAARTAAEQVNVEWRR